MRRPARIPAHLPASVHERLNAYALAASAAGIGALALAQPANAKIIYTPSDCPIPRNLAYKIDLNQDGTTDLSIFNRFSLTNSGAPYGLLDAGPSRGNYVEGSGGRPFALKRGEGVGAPWNSNPAELMALATSNKAAGNWVNVNDRYLGVKFQIKGKYHYGWVRMTVEVTGPSINATVDGYAFETIAGKSIKAGQTKEADDQVNQDSGPGASLSNPIPVPQPASLGALAMGVIWRRKELALD
jgi:hypothetical protein